MNLNNNIKLIIYNYYTYSDKQILSFRKDWQNNISKTNQLFNISIFDYRKPCFICKKNNHLNKECFKFYSNLHIINSIGSKDF